MKNDVVFTDKMNEFGVIAFPVIFPVFIVFFRPSFGRGDVTDRRVKPHVQHFSFRLGQRYFYAPVQIARNRARQQSLFGIEPRFALTDNVIFPSSGVVVFFSVERSFFNPLFQTAFVFF